MEIFTTIFIVLESLMFGGFSAWHFLFAYCNCRRKMVVPKTGERVKRKKNIVDTYKIQTVNYYWNK